MNAQEIKETEEFLNPIWEEAKQFMYKEAERLKTPLQQVKNVMSAYLRMMKEEASIELSDPKERRSPTMGRG